MTDAKGDSSGWEGAESAEAPPPRNLTLLARREAWALMLCRFLVGPVVQEHLRRKADTQSQDSP